MKLQDQTAMAALQQQIGSFRELQDEVHGSVVKFYRSEAASNQPGSRFLRVDERQLPEEVDRSALAAATQALREIYVRATTGARCDLEEFDHVGLLERASPPARSTIVEWNLYHNLAVSVGQVRRTSKGYDHVPVHALKAEMTMAMQQARCRSFADMLTLHVFDRAGIPASGYAEAWQSGYPPAIALAEGMLRHSLHLLNRPGGMDREDAPKLVAVATELCIVIDPKRIGEFKLTGAPAAAPGPAGNRG